MRNFTVMMFPNPERKVLKYTVNADYLEIDPRGNAVFKTDGRIVGIVSNPAYQIIKEIVEVEIVKK
jgi:hypothetical protein